MKSFGRYVTPYTDYADEVLRVGLGAVILLAGVHKLVDPAAWSAYAAPLVVALWPVSMDATMVLNGVLEAIVGLAILIDSYTTVAAAIVALSLLGVVVDLLLAAAMTGKFLDVAIRDVGLTVLAIGVMLQSAPHGSR